MEENSKQLKVNELKLRINKSDFKKVNDRSQEDIKN